MLSSDSQDWHRSYFESKLPPIPRTCASMSRDGASLGADSGNGNHLLSLVTTMSLIAGVRKAFVFVFVFGVLVPRTFAAFAVCQAGWEWVSDPSGFSFLDNLASRRRPN